MSWLLRRLKIKGRETTDPAPEGNNRPDSGVPVSSRSGPGGSAHFMTSAHGPSGNAIVKSSSKETQAQVQPPPSEEVSQNDEDGDGDMSTKSQQGTEIDVDDTQEPIPNQETEPKREAWHSKVGYILTLVGLAVGFGNVWRFPPLMHSKGGVAFLIPYCIMLAFAGIPIFFLELAVGQRLRKGSLGSWNEISPYLGGLGLASGFICFMQEIYYNVLLAWVLLYLVDSFRGTLPWAKCTTITNNNWENEPRINTSHGSAPEECLASNQASKYYFYRRMVDVSESITDPGNFNPWMLLMITISWLMVLAIIIKGIKSSEKVVYVTALFPYVTLIIFFGANFFVDGWREGYEILMAPDLDKLMEADTWLAAGSQIFFSLSVGVGCLIIYASYIPSNNNCHRDAVMVSLINCATSVLAAIVLFPVFGSIGKTQYKHCLQQRLGQALIALGHATQYDLEKDNLREDWYKDYRMEPVEKGNITKIWFKNQSFPDDTPLSLSIQNVNCETMKYYIQNSGTGTGLVFIGFAEAVTNMPCPPFWSILFFFMLITLGIDTSFGTLEGAIAVVVDLKIVKLPRWAITCIMVGTLQILTLVFCWGWGIYIQVFLDQFIANWTLLLVGFMETVGIAWVYGLAKFSYDIKLMTGHRPNLFILMCWKFFTPILILMILIMSVVQKFRDEDGPFKYDVYDKAKGDLKKDDYPVPIIILGYVLMLLVVIWVPLQAILVWRGKSLLKKEIPAPFPEEELRAERLMGKDEKEEFDILDRLVMGKSVEEFQAAERKSMDPSSSAQTSSASDDSTTDTIISDDTTKSSTVGQP